MCTPQPQTEGGLINAATNLSMDAPNFGHCELGLDGRPIRGWSDYHFQRTHGHLPTFSLGNCNVAGLGSFATGPGIAVPGPGGCSCAFQTALDTIVHGCGEDINSTCCTDFSTYNNLLRVHFL